MELDRKERTAILKMEGLAECWPDSLWLYSTGGTLCVMKKNRQGERAMLPNGSVDPDYHIENIEIENDGGDW